jgi:hypothetical protein
MNLTKEKEKIKREIDLIDDPKIIKAIKQLLAEHEADETPPMMVNEPPIEDWEMATPEGRTPTPEQFEKWLDRQESDDEEMTLEEAKDYIRRRSEARGANKKAS